MRRHGPIIAQCTDSVVFPFISALKINDVMTEFTNVSTLKCNDSQYEALSMEWKRAGVTEIG